MPSFVDGLPVDEPSKSDDIKIVVRQVNGEVQVTLFRAGGEVDLTKHGGVDWTLTLQGHSADLDVDLEIDGVSLKKFMRK